MLRGAPQPPRALRQERSTTRKLATAYASPSSRPSAPVAGTTSTVHPSVLLDAACAACCTILLATSAARRRALSRGVARNEQELLPNACGGRTAAAAPCKKPAAEAAQVVPASPVYPEIAVARGIAGDAIIACILLSAIGNVAYKLAGNGQQRASQGLALESAARLAQLEALTQQQLAEFASASRQIDKLQVRTRVTSVDLRRPIAQLQGASAEHAALLARLATEVEALRGQLRDTQGLLAALQGLSAKQFQVTVDAIKQLRAKVGGG